MTKVENSVELLEGAGLPLLPPGAAKADEPVVGSTVNVLGTPLLATEVVSIPVELLEALGVPVLGDCTVELDMAEPVPLLDALKILLLAVEVTNVEPVRLDTEEPVTLLDAIGTLLLIPVVAASDVNAELLVVATPASDAIEAGELVELAAAPERLLLANEVASPELGGGEVVALMEKPLLAIEVGTEVGDSEGDEPKVRVGNPDELPVALKIPVLAAEMDVSKLVKEFDAAEAVEPLDAPEIPLLAPEVVVAELVTFTSTLVTELTAEDTTPELVALPLTEELAVAKLLPVLTLPLPLTLSLTVARGLPLELPLELTLVEHSVTVTVAVALTTVSVVVTVTVPAAEQGGHAPEASLSPANHQQKLTLKSKPKHISQFSIFHSPPHRDGAQPTSHPFNKKVKSF